MTETNKKTIYQFTTSSKGIARVVDIIIKDHKCRQMVHLFSQIKTGKRRSLILRLTQCLINNSLHHLPK